MAVVGTILYEDQMHKGAGGSFPLHDLVMRMVEDDINGLTWRLRPLLRSNARKGVDNIIQDVKRASLIAGPGTLFILLDRDVVGKHLKLAANASDRQVVEALQRDSDAPEKLRVFFLYPNLEGLLRAIQRCDEALLPETMTAALSKKLNDRDIILNETKRAARKHLRGCLREAQPGLDALVLSIAGAIPPDSIGI